MTKNIFVYLWFTKDDKEMSPIMISNYEGRQSSSRKNMTMTVGKMNSKFYEKCTEVYDFKIAKIPRRQRLYVICWY